MPGKRERKYYIIANDIIIPLKIFETLLKVFFYSLPEDMFLLLLEREEGRERNIGVREEH